MFKKLNDDAIDQGKNLEGETVDLWEANDLFLSHVGF